MREHCPEPILGELPVIRVNAPQILLVAGIAIVGGIPKQPAMLIGPSHLVRRHIPLPTTHVRHSLRFRQPCFAAFKFFLGPLALDGEGDLISHGGEELQVALAISVFHVVVLHG